MKKLILSIISILLIGLFDATKGELSELTIVSYKDISTPGTWLGTTNTNWNLYSNWSDGIVPNSSTNVTIPSVSNQPIISTSAECKDIFINTYAKLSITGSNVLTVSGNWTNDGTLSPYASTVTFNGSNQTVVKGTFQNLTCKGSGIKTLTGVTVNGILSLEETASVKNTPIYGPSSSLRYNTSIDRTTGDEWASISYFGGGGIIIENSGHISINSNKVMEVHCPLTIVEGSILNIGTFYVNYINTLILTCGGQTRGSTILGTGILYLNGNVMVNNAGHGVAGATINCPITQSGSSTYTIANNSIIENSDDDLTVNGLNGSNTLIKAGTGTLNFGIQPVITTSLTIAAGNIIVPVGGNVIVSGTTDIQTIAGLIIKSDETGTGSFITNTTTGIGTAIVTCAMTPSAWHLVASPLAGQSINKFLNANITIPTDEYANRGMRNYNAAMNYWNDFFTNQTLGDIITGLGYGMRVRLSQSHKVIFTGKLNAGPINVSGLTMAKWNCVGNPYTSAIAINTAGGSTQQFINSNLSNLDPAYGAIYIWDQPDASNGLSGKYTIISNASAGFNVQLGQGFMVKMAPGKTSLSFNRSMQFNKPNLLLKSTDGVWPTIKLMASADSLHSSTIITFNEGMTKGLDPSYDAGIFPSLASLNLYTRLVDDYGLPFAIQALPADTYETIVVPVGIDCTYGGAVSFSAEGNYLPAACTPIFEDRFTHTFTDLSSNSYTAELPAGQSGTGRFFLHTSYNTTRVRSQSAEARISAWVIGNTEIRIKGPIDKNTLAILYNSQGKVVVSQQLNAGNENSVVLPKIISGIYILHIKSKSQLKILRLSVLGN